MSGIKDLIESLLSCSIDFGGKGLLSGGKNALVGGAQKIGWAKGGGGNGHAGRRFGGHSIHGKSLASGFGFRRAPLGGKYDPKKEYAQIQNQHFSKGRASGTGAAQAPRKKQAPEHLFGRSAFRPGNSSPKSHNPYSSSARGRPSLGPSTFSTRPRGNIKY